MRIFSSFGHSPGNVVFPMRLQTPGRSRPRFSEVGTTRSNASTSAVQSCGARTGRAPAAPPSHSAERCPPRAPYAPSAARARSTPPRSCGRARRDDCISRTAAGSLLAQPGRMQAVRGCEFIPPRHAETRLASEVIHVQVRGLVHAKPNATCGRPGSMCGTKPPPDVPRDVLGGRKLTRSNGGHFVIQKPVVVRLHPLRG